MWFQILFLLVLSLSTALLHYALSQLSTTCAQDLHGKNTACMMEALSCWYKCIHSAIVLGLISAEYHLQSPTDLGERLCQNP